MLCINCLKHNWKDTRSPYCVFCITHSTKFYVQEKISQPTEKALFALPREKRNEICLAVAARLKQFKGHGITREWNAELMFKDYTDFVKNGMAELDIPPSIDTEPDQRYRQYESPKNKDF